MFCFFKCSLARSVLKHSWSVSNVFAEQEQSGVLMSWQTLLSPIYQMAVLGAHTHGSPNLNQLAPAYSAPAHILVPVSLPERERERKRGRGERVLPHRPTPEILSVHLFMQSAQLKMRQLSSVGVQKSRHCFSFCLISVVNIGSYFWTPPCCKSPIEKNN